MNRSTGIYTMTKAVFESFILGNLISNILILNTEFHRNPTKTNEILHTNLCHKKVGCLLLLLDFNCLSAF